MILIGMINTQLWFKAKSATLVIHVLYVLHIGLNTAAEILLNKMHIYYLISQ
jgi:hypothetical protein